MWPCSYCRKRFVDRSNGINHARAAHTPGLHLLRVRAASAADLAPARAGRGPRVGRLAAG